jgi:hypothetical protein
LSWQHGYSLRFVEQLDLALEQLVLQRLAGQVQLDLVLPLRLAGAAVVECIGGQVSRCQDLSMVGNAASVT